MNIGEMDALQFQEHFGTDEQCRDFLFARLGLDAHLLELLLERRGVAVKPSL